jgi:2-polyprenyl-6-methoxyphenol hydroxylase-like FAD-dependent oxidoreductase
MAPPRILISGCGIAGPALAFWLSRLGIEPTIIERAPRPRESGYMIDVWGLGYAMTERMGLKDRLRSLGYDISELRLVDRGGARIAAIDGDVIRSALSDRFFSIARGDLAKAIYDEVENRAGFMFGDTITGLDQHEDGVDATFETAAPQRFDLVIGADGLHSVVRGLVFGPEIEFETFLGYRVAAFTADGYPHRDRNAYVSHTVPGRQIARYTLRDDKTGFYLIFRDDSRSRVAPFDHDEAKDFLEEKYRGVGWEAPEMLDALRVADDLYFDVVSQIHMDHWSRGRVALLGDAASCPSLLAGEGSAFAMAGGYLLAHAIAESDGDHAAAFARYESAFKNFVTGKQKAASRMGGWFAPKTETTLVIRNLITRLLATRGFGAWAIRRMFQDDSAVPELARN